MAQDQLQGYEDAWSAIYQLIDRGGSWSGRERNCCFLNTGGRRFADVSASSDLDFDDDGRGVAIVDWDFDGFLDLWVTNRTAPRVRLLRNAKKGSHHFLAFRLLGMSSNRDAIGARLELFLDGDSKKRLIKTLRAGDGFLAQSSKWVHFGLGDTTRIDRLVVHWPGKGAETFKGLEVDSRYKLVQGGGQAQLWTPPRGPLELKPAPVNLPSVTAQARTWLMGRLPMPDATYKTWDGTDVALDSYRGQPLLVNLWSTTCAPCVREMSEWAQAKTAIGNAGLNILSACVDRVSESSGNAASIAPRLLERIEFPFLTGTANLELIDAMEAVHRFYFERQQALPVPCSFLLDHRGDVAAIYKGPISADQLLADQKILGTASRAQRDSTIPFPGRWASNLSIPNPRPLVALFVKAGQHDEAIAYLRKYLTRTFKLAAANTSWHRARARLYRTLGDLLWSKNKQPEALEAYAKILVETPEDVRQHLKVADKIVRENHSKEALQYLESAWKLNPGASDLRFHFAVLLRQTDRPWEAVPLLRDTVRQSPTAVAAHFELAEALRAADDVRTAITHFRTAHRLLPNSFATNSLAWILATHHDPGIRNGREAVQLAEQACQVQGYANPATLSTLGASYAEIDRFDKAIAVASKAIVLAREAGDVEFVERLSEQLSLYASGRPGREGR